MITPSALVCGLTEDPVGQRSEGCSAVGDALNCMDGETVLIVRLDGPKRGDGIALKDEDEEVGNTQKDVGDVHDIDGEDVGPFDGDAEKEQTLAIKRRLEFATVVLGFASIFFCLQLNTSTCTSQRYRTVHRTTSTWQWS